MNVNFRLEKTTPGALRFQEVDEHGTPLKIGAGAVIGTLYVRKTAFANGEEPKSLAIAVTVS